MAIHQNRAETPNDVASDRTNGSSSSQWKGDVGVNDVVRDIQENGFCVVSLKDNSKELMLALAEELGTVQPYNANRIDEVFEIRSDAQSNAPSHHRASGTGRLWPHTDAAYLPGDGLSPDGATDDGPPALIVLQCVRPADEGGSTTLTDVEEVIGFLTSEERDDVCALQTRGGLEFQKDTILAANKRLFRPISNNRWAIRFRLDLLRVPNEIYDPAIRVASRLLEPSPAQKTVRLRMNDVLIIDNHRMLHGRSAIVSGNRFFRRIWLRTANLLPVTGIRSSFLGSLAFPTSAGDPHTPGTMRPLLEHFL